MVLIKFIFLFLCNIFEIIVRDEFRKKKVLIIFLKFDPLSELSTSKFCCVHVTTFERRLKLRIQCNIDLIIITSF